MNTLLLLLELLIPPSLEFFLTASSCSSCPPMHPACPPQPNCQMHGVTTHQVVTAPITIPDELEMRAAAFGVPIAHHPKPPTNLEEFERMVDRQEAMFTATTTPLPVSPPTEEDSGISAGLRGHSEVRRAPIVHVSHQEDASIAENLASGTEEEEEEEEEEEPVTPVPETNSKCNSQVLKKLMLEQMTANSSESKRRINIAAEEKFGGNVDVICSRGHFSYVFSSNLYCEATKDLVTCIAFRQTVSA